jgi:hypothetical protein
MADASDVARAVQRALHRAGAPAPLRREVAGQVLADLGVDPTTVDLAEDPFAVTASQLRSAGMDEATITSWREGAARAAETDEEAIARLADPTPTVAPLPAAVLAEIDASLAGLDLDADDREEVRRLAIDQALEQRGPG